MALHFDHMLPILNQSLWRDEAFSALLSQNSLVDIVRLTMQDVSPPLYYFVLHYWMLLFGNNEVVLRSLSFVFHLATVVIVFFIARKLISSLTAQIIVAGAVLLNPFLLQYAFEARPYSMLVFLSMLAIYFLISKKHIAGGIILGIAILTHNFAVFTTVACALWWIFINRQHKFPFEKTVEIFFAPILAILMWGSVIWSQWIKVAGGFWIEQATSTIFLRSLEVYTRGDLGFETQSLLFFVSLIVLFFAFSYWVWNERKNDHYGISLLVFVLSVPLLITYTISALFSPIYHERYLIATNPVLIILAGYSLYQLFIYNKRLQTVLVAVIAIYAALLVQSSEQIVGATTKPALNWGVNQIISKAQPGDIIVPKDILNFLEAKYYVQQSDKLVPVYAYSPSGKIPFYVGKIFYQPSEIITSLPKNQRIWQIKPDGGYKLLTE